MRILVTGSRGWPYPYVVAQELSKVVGAGGAEAWTVVHGACPAGVDAQADDWARMAQGPVGAGYRLSVERHPADWKQYGKAAGFIRNQQMVDAGADLCLAFIFNGSRGATHCLERARSASIPARVVELRIEDYKGSYE